MVSGAEDSSSSDSSDNEQSGEVVFNIYGHIIKGKKKLFKRSLALLKLNVSVTYDRFEQVPVEIIDDIWDSLREEFNIPVTLKKLVVSKFAGQLLHWKKRLRMKYFNGLNSTFIASLKDHNPKHIQVEAWNAFVAREASTAKLLQRQQAAENRASKTDKHFIGQFSYAQIVELLKSKGLPHSRVDVFLYARKRKDGTYHPDIFAEMEALENLHNEESSSNATLANDALSRIHNGIGDRPLGIGSKTSRTRALMVEEMVEIQNMNKKKRTKKRKKSEKMEKRLEILEAAILTKTTSNLPLSLDKNPLVPSHTPSPSTTLSGTPTSHTHSQCKFNIRSTSDYAKIVGQGMGSSQPIPGGIVHHRQLLPIERKISLEFVREGMENEHLYLGSQGCATTLGEMLGGFMIWPMYLLEEVQD